MKDVVRGKDLTFHRIGSMFCLYFRGGPIRNLADAKMSDTGSFAWFFHGALNQGIYLAPSQFEAGFLSTIHTHEVIDRTSKAVARIIADL